MSASPALDEPPGSTAVSGSQIPQLRRDALKVSNVESCFSNVHVTLTGGSFLTGYAVMLGASDFDIGIMSSLPHFLQIFQVAAAYVTWRVGSRRAVCTAGVAVWRGVALLLALLPFVPGMSIESRVGTFLALLVLSNLAAMFTINAWSVWMADLVPGRIRGRYFGYRSMLGLMVAVTVSMIGARFLDLCRTGDSVGEKTGFLLTFGIAAAAAVTGLSFLRRQWEPPMRQEAPPRFKELVAIFHRADFRGLCLFFFVWNFGIGLSASFAAKLMLHHLQMDYWTASLYGVVVSVAGFLTARQCGRVIDAWGTKPTLAVCAAAVAFTPLLWILARPGFLLPLWIDGILTGVFWTGFNLAALNLPWIVTPEKNRGYFLGIFTTIAGLGIGTASVLSGHLAECFAAVRIAVPGLGHPLINYHLIFMLSAAVRLLSLPLVPRDPGVPLFPSLGRFVRKLQPARLASACIAIVKGQ